ncbi:MAG: hypothetical protein LBC20_04425 [Planctomycetaceae bacterium]|jgi:hypothetical protein|nr:hypothetical protein [Planctomycetaceae bacterium]
MSVYIIEPLWSQGGGEQIIGIVIFALLVIAQILKAYFDTRSVQQTGTEKRLQKPIQNTELNDPLNSVSLSQTTKRPRERKRSPRKQTLTTETASEHTRKSRGILSRELGPQGEGSRFETVTGTFNSSQIITSSITPIVKPTLESLTGIYDTPPVSSETQPQPLALNVKEMIADSEGLRQAVILSEILKRPNF